MKKETKLQELERRIASLEKDKNVYIQVPQWQPSVGTAENQRTCTCNHRYSTPTRPPCPIHGTFPNYYNCQGAL